MGSPHKKTSKSNKNGTEYNLKLNGNDLSVKDLSLFVLTPRAKIEFAEHVRSSVMAARRFLMEEMGKRIIYGVNTGFGPMASYVIPKEHLIQLQENLIRSHAVGIGKPLPSPFVLAAMAVRLNTLAKGYSGVTMELLEHLKQFINHRIIPVVPEHGAVGTSGDLVQLAHIALALKGEGSVQYRQKTMNASEALKLTRLTPYAYREKEGLSVINGTSMMSGIASLVCFEVERIIILSVRLGAMALELAHGFNDSTSEKLHRLRPHRGQLVIARSLRDILASSHMRRDRRHMRVTNGENGEVSEQVEKIAETVQEIYSFRCIPQILGPLFDAWERAVRIVETEINSVSDNPIVDWENKSFIHGGNFHGDYIGYAVDQLKIPLVKLSLMSERRINFFLNNNINKFFPPFMNLAKPGLTLGLQGLQFVATSTAAQNQTYAYPHSVHSISTNADNQDVVSMGTDAALIAWHVVENTYVVLAIELITLAQAVDYLGTKTQLSASSQALYTGIRPICKKIENDRVLTDDVQNVAAFIRNNFALDKQWLKI